MVLFSQLNKLEKDLWLPKLFDLLYSNMASFMGDYATEKELWLSNVSPALDKDPRQIILCLAGNEPVGFLQYYKRDTLLMVEEVQIKEEYQNTFLFYRLCRHLMHCLTEGITTIEAFAEVRNLKSQKLMGKLGMEIIDANPESPFVHLRGSAATVMKHFLRPHGGDCYDT